MLASRRAYSYRDDPAVPPFPDDRPLIVFDEVCVLCSGFARFVLRRDRKRGFRFTAAGSPLGQALFRHYGLPTEDYETNLLLADGLAFTKSEAFIEIVARLGRHWPLLRASRVVPRTVRDWSYDRIARNRYRLFGRTPSCMIPPPDAAERFLS